LKILQNIKKKESKKIISYISIYLSYIIIYIFIQKIISFPGRRSVVSVVSDVPYGKNWVDTMVCIARKEVKAPSLNDR